MTKPDPSLVPVPIITIDGPAGAGKSTLARALAAALGWTYLDTGAMYRAVAWAMDQAGPGEPEEATVTKLMAGLRLEVLIENLATRVLVDGRDITSEIRAPRISGLASKVSAWGVVRRAMVDMQRRLGAQGRVVVEGRDMGTVVFPEASLKFFLSASLAERARRRHEELIGRGQTVDLDQVTREMAQRDEADAARTLAPLRPAPDAIQVDSTDLTISEVLAVMLTRGRPLAA